MTTLEEYMPILEAICEGKGARLLAIARHFTILGLKEFIDPRTSQAGFSEIAAVAAESCGLTEEEARFAGYLDSLPWDRQMVIEFTIAYFE